MRWTILSFMLTGCVSLHQEERYRFGDRVELHGSWYEGCVAVVKQPISDKYSLCEQHEYYAMILRNGVWTEDYICGENINGRY